MVGLLVRRAPARLLAVISEREKVAERFELEAGETITRNNYEQNKTEHNTMRRRRRRQQTER